jgi:3'(2'), 5'-bisphosphate nucleotidase
MGIYPAHTEKLLNHLPAMTNIVRRIASAAGDVVMDHYDPSGFHGEVMVKDDGSPVTAADFAADAVIRDALASEFPGIPIITEETVDTRDHDLLGAAPHYWLVDPIDGTKHFRAGHKDFGVNIALIHHDVPVLGVIYAPAHGEGFAGHAAGPAMRWLDDSEKEHEMRVRSLPAEGITLITNPTSKTSPALQALIDQIKMARHVRRGSTLKFCEVAAARADLYPRFKETYYWDSAAGDIILRASGGHVMDMTGERLKYDRTRPSLSNTGFIACSDIEYAMPIFEDLRARDLLPKI